MYECGGAELDGEAMDAPVEGGPSRVDALQFYETPKWLADKAFGAFKNKNPARLLDACAGAGALADAWMRHHSWQYSGARRGDLPVDCVELDVRHHPALRDKGYGVVGIDFLAFEGGACYDAIISNPPFAKGAQHVLKAWDCLWAGEVVAIINAETIRNPFSTDRKRLATLIEKHGDVEYVKDAFRGPGVERQAEVEVAIVHLVKEAECESAWIGEVIDGLKDDSDELARKDGGRGAFELPRDLALPDSFVANQVRAFRQAVKAMRNSVTANAAASYYASRIGASMADLQAQRGSRVRVSEDAVRKELQAKYGDLKDRAWASVMRSAVTLSKLSQKVQRQAEAQFAQIKMLQFDEPTVWGFLCGLVEAQPELQAEMMEDVFDQISRYHPDNVVYHRGWVSNAKHRVCGMRIKMTRFILPGHRLETYQSQVPWDTLQMLNDFDKVFSMLDGVKEPGLSLAAAASANMDVLKRGGRVSSTFFEFRWFKGVGTMHFYPKRKDLIDRLNRLVGARRAWLPPVAEQGQEGFWKAYSKAESLDAEVREAIAKQRGAGARYWNDPQRRIHSTDEADRREAFATMNAAIDSVLEKHGLLESIGTADAKRIGQGAGAAAHTAPLLLTAA